MPHFRRKSSRCKIQPSPPLSLPPHLISSPQKHHPNLNIPTSILKMTSQEPAVYPIIPSFRSSSRLLVRELGFMSSNLAGTTYSASAVHAIIEIGLHQPEPNKASPSVAIPSSSSSSRGTSTSASITAAALCTELNLEKSSVSRLLKKLVEAGEVREGFGDDAREKVLYLTEKGRGTLKGIDVCFFLNWCNI